MRRRDLVTTLRALAADHNARLVFEREGRNHEIWSMNGQRIPIPRHREINEVTAQNIIKDAEKAARGEP